jgi:hypothetical protein
MRLFGGKAPSWPRPAKGIPAIIAGLRREEVMRVTRGLHLLQLGRC